MWFEKDGSGWGTHIIYMADSYQMYIIKPLHVLLK